MKKRILSTSLAAVIGLSSVVPAFAAVTPVDGLLNATGEYANSTGSVVADKDAVDINGVAGKDSAQGKYSQYDTVVDGYTGTTMDETESEVNVYATVAPSYSIKIPKTIILSSGGLGLYDIGVKGDMSGAQTLTIRPDDKIADTTETDFYMSEQNAFIGKKDDIVAVVEQNKTEWTWSDINKDNYTWLAEAGKITAEDISAGSWAGTFDFVIGMDIEAAPSATTNYTKEEVDANERLIPIGKTDPYYVVAAFNDDYSDVVITKNGENSDGLMMEFGNLETQKLYTTILYDHANTVESITVKEGVTSIGQGAFYMYDTLTNVKIADSVKTIEGGAFYSCTVLTNLNLGNGVETINYGAFSGCSTLKTINIPNSVTVIDKYAFSDTGLVSVIIPNGVESIKEYAFASCKNLTNITINAPKLTMDVGAFAGTKPTDLTVLAVNSLPTGEGWCNHTGIKRLTIGTEVIESRFYPLNPDVESITILDGVTTIKNSAFGNLYGNDDSVYEKEPVIVTIPSSVTVIEPSAFSYQDTHLSHTNRRITIYGEAGSAAEEYANEYDHITFVAI